MSKNISDTYKQSNKMSKAIKELFSKLREDDTEFTIDDFEEQVMEIVKDLEKSVKKSKKKKDPKAPKKNVSAWVMFCKANRAQVKEENPDLKPKEIMSKLAALWKVAKDDEDVMAEFKVQADADKERYAEEMKDYVPSEEEFGDGEKKKKKRVKLPGQPKGAKSAWLYFCEAERKVLKKEKSELKGKEIMPELAKRWKKLKNKKKYEKLAKADKERYTEEMKEFKAKMESEAEEDSVQAGSDSEKEDIEDDDEILPPPPMIEDEDVEEEVEKPKKKKGKKGKKTKIVEEDIEDE